MKNFEIRTIAEELATPKLRGDNLTQQIFGLKRRYDEPWRHHHNFEHPLSLFSKLFAEARKELLEDPIAVGWAIMYHDAIYDPKSEPGRNEELSALLSEVETPLFLSARGVTKVASYTRATAGHKLESIDNDLGLFLDADLAILGAPSQRYFKYAKGIRQEYSHVPLDLYNAARVGILRSLSTRFEGSGVYTTEVFREKYEDQAQANIQAEIDQLSITS